MSGFSICVESFTDSDGRTYFAGISHAANSCDIVRKYPSKWGSHARTVDLDGFTRSEQRSGSGATVAPSASGQRIDRVVLTAWARRQLDEQGYDSLCEVGGGLFGCYDQARCEIVIDDVTGRVEDASEASGQLDLPYILRMEQRHAETTRRLELQGIWHSHPSGQGGASRTDQAIFRSWFRAGGEKPFVGLIVSKNDNEWNDWVRPVLTAHVVTRSGIISTVPVEVERERVAA